MEMAPRCFSSSVSVASLFSTPRGLNDPVRWKRSALKCTSARTRSESVADERSGVRWSRSPIRSRARYTSSREISESVVATRRSYFDAASDVLFALRVRAAPVDATLALGVRQEPALRNRRRNDGREHDDRHEERELRLVDDSRVEAVKRGDRPKGESGA